MTTSIPPFTPEQVAQFRQRLEDEASHVSDVRTSLESGLDTANQEPSNDRTAQEEDAAADLTAQEQYGAQSRDLANALHAVEAALERLTAGSYGLCAGCHQPIPIARLEFLPTAERCVACEGKRERSRRR